MELIALNNEALQYAKGEERAKISKFSAIASTVFLRVIYLSEIEPDQRLLSDQSIEHFKILDPSMELRGLAKSTRTLARSSDSNSSSLYRVSADRAQQATTPPCRFDIQRRQ